VTRPRADVLVLCYGNPGRLDDGLGPALARELTGRPVPGVEVEEAWQLQVEHAERIAAFDLVVFVDADAACAEPFELRPIEPRTELSFSSHSVAPEALLALAREHFASQVRGLVLGIRGWHFDGFGERLSARARVNLAAAARFMDRALSSGELCDPADASASRR